MRFRSPNRMVISRAIVFTLALSASQIAAAAEAVFPPGSRIGLTPPADMALSKRFSGFEDAGKGAAITLVEMPPQAYAELRAGLTDEALKAQGVTVQAREDLRLGNAEAMLVSGEQSAAGVAVRKWLLVASDPTLTAFVIAQAPQGGAYPEAAIREALQTIALRAPLPVEDQVAALPFRLADRAGLRPVRIASGNALLLTDGPSDTVSAPEQPLVVVALAPEPPPPPTMRNELARGALFSNPALKEIVIERADGFRQRGIEWHEIVARAKDVQSGQPVVVMQTLRFSPQNYVRLLGVARADIRDDILPRLRAVADGIEVD
jgi:hypothetical protein